MLIDFPFTPQQQPQLAIFSNDILPGYLIHAAELHDPPAVLLHRLYTRAVLTMCAAIVQDMVVSTR